LYENKTEEVLLSTYSFWHPIQFAVVVVVVTGGIAVVVVDVTVSPSRIALNSWGVSHTPFPHRGSRKTPKATEVSSQEVIAAGESTLGAIAPEHVSAVSLATVKMADLTVLVMR